MATTKTRTKTYKKPTPTAQRTTETIVCPHCGECFDVSANGCYICPECEDCVEVSIFETPAVSQHPSKREKDYNACGWATTKWLLQSFDVLDVSDVELRKELNTDAEVGIRALVTPILRRLGVPLENVKGTLPWAIISVLSKRGISIMNPIRLERFSEYTRYLNDTFDAGGYAAILTWRKDENGWIAHWMGVERHAGRIRVMDPWTGSYKAFREATTGWDNFIVCGFVRK